MHYRRDRARKLHVNGDNCAAYVAVVIANIPIAAVVNKLSYNIGFPWTLQRRRRWQRNDDISKAQILKVHDACTNNANMRGRKYIRMQSNAKQATWKVESEQTGKIASLVRMMREKVFHAAVRFLCAAATIRKVDLRRQHKQKSAPAEGQSVKPARLNWCRCAVGSASQAACEVHKIRQVPLDEVTLGCFLILY